MTCFLGLACHVRPSTLSLPKERHRRQSLDPCSAQELQEQRFHLVVLVVREGDVIARLAGKHFVARGPRGRLDARAARDGDFGAAKGNAAPAAKAAAESRPARGVRAQLVIDVQRGKTDGEPRAEPVQKIEQDHRIDPAAHGRRDAGAGPHRPGELRTDPFDQFLRRADGGLIAAALP